jgi:hypothetical protein
MSADQAWESASDRFLDASVLAIKMTYFIVGLRVGGAPLAPRQ